MSFNQLFSFNCVLTKAVHRILRSCVCVWVWECVQEKREGRRYCEYYYRTLITWRQREWGENGSTDWETEGTGCEWGRRRQSKRDKTKKKKEEMKELGHINPFSIVPIVNTFNTYTDTTESEAAANQRGAIHRKGARPSSVESFVSSVTWKQFWIW